MTIQYTVEIVPPAVILAIGLAVLVEWKSFLHVTLPGLRPVTISVTILNLIALFQSFCEFYIMLEEDLLRVLSSR